MLVKILVFSSLIIDGVNCSFKSSKFISTYSLKFSSFLILLKFNVRYIIAKIATSNVITKIETIKIKILYLVLYYYLS